MIVVTMVLMCLPNAPIARSVDQPVVINELLWMGSDRSSSDEWIELRNLTTAPIDLTGWQLTKHSGGAEVPMLTFPNGTIAAQGYFLIANYSETHANSALDITPDLVTSDVALANSALQITLYDAAGVLIDRADDGSGNPLSGVYDNAAEKYISMERNRVPGDGQLAQSWHPNTQAVNIKATSLVQATPGAKNSNAAPVAVVGSDVTGQINLPVNFDGSDSYDPDADPLSYSWDFGDGTTASGVTPEHIFTAAGDFAVVLTVSDSALNSTVGLTASITSPPAPSTSTPNPSRGETATPSSSCRGLRLSELWPNPAGVDDGEFIELENVTGQAILLAGCKLWVNDKRVYTFSDGQAPARGFVVADKATTKLSLTNAGGTVRLEDSDGTELDRAEYAKAKDDLSWSRFADSWGWTETPTPGATNQAPNEDGAVAGASTSAQTGGGHVVVDAAIGEIQEQDSGDRVHVQGIITAPVDALGTRVTYLQDASGAVSLLLAEDADKPDLGDQVDIVGIVRSYQGRKRLSVAKQDLQILGSDPWSPKAITIDELSPDLADQLVTVSGAIGAISGTKITLDDGSGEGTIYLKSSTGILKPKMYSGDTLTVTGIVNVTTASGIRIMPRQNQDLVVDAQTNRVNTNQTTQTTLPTAPVQHVWWYWILVGTGAGAVSIKPLWTAWRKRKDPSREQSSTV